MFFPGLGEHGKSHMQWLRDTLELRATAIQAKEDAAIQEAKEVAGEKDAMEDDTSGAGAADPEADAKAAGVRAAAQAAAEALPLVPSNPVEAVLLQKLIGMLGFVAGKVTHILTL